LEFGVKISFFTLSGGGGGSRGCEEIGKPGVVNCVALAGEREREREREAAREREGDSRGCEEVGTDASVRLPLVSVQGLRFTVSG